MEAGGLPAEAGSAKRRSKCISNTITAKYLSPLFNRSSHCNTAARAASDPGSSRMRRMSWATNRACAKKRASESLSSRQSWICFSLRSAIALNSRWASALASAC